MRLERRFANLLTLVCFLAWIITSLLVTALLQSCAMAKLWSWFAAPKYGPGPSLGAWFGIALIIRMMLQGEPKKDHRGRWPWETDDDLDLWGTVRASLWIWGGILFALAAAWSMGAAVGWIR
jgi:ABC-type sugar transport system permease subunit